MTQPTLEHTAEQLAIFHQRLDALVHGAGKVDGVVRPTWDEIGAPGREEYLTDATRTVKAMWALGWRPHETVGVTCTHCHAEIGTAANNGEAIDLFEAHLHNEHPDMEGTTDADHH